MLQVHVLHFGRLCGVLDSFCLYLRRLVVRGHRCDSCVQRVQVFIAVYLAGFLILLVQLFQVVVADFVQLELVAILFYLVLKLSLQVAILVLKCQDLLSLLEDKGLELAYSQNVMLIGKGTRINSSRICVAVTSLEPHLLFKEA